LNLAHQNGLFHGLVKPSNVMISGPQVRLLDFGIGSLLAENEGESLVDTMSTSNGADQRLDCSSPESIMEPTNRTPAGDQYGLGCVLYYCLTGRYPFPDGSAVEKMMAHQFKQPTPLAELAPNAPKELIAVVEKLMEKKPEDRYHGVDETMEGAASAGRPADGDFHTGPRGAGRRRGGADADAAAANAKCGRTRGTWAAGSTPRRSSCRRSAARPRSRCRCRRRCRCRHAARCAWKCRPPRCPRRFPPVRRPPPCAGPVRPPGPVVAARSGAVQGRAAERGRTDPTPAEADSSPDRLPRLGRDRRGHLLLGGAHADEVRRIPVSGWRKPVESSSGQRLSEDATGSRQPAGFAMPTHFSKKRSSHA